MVDFLDVGLSFDCYCLLHYTIRGIKRGDTMNGMCKCGHDINFHIMLSGSQCHEMDCNCQKYEEEKQ